MRTRNTIVGAIILLMLLGIATMMPRGPVDRNAALVQTSPAKRETKIEAPPVKREIKVERRVRRTEKSAVPGGCGSYGGPGYRLANGKCASWADERRGRR